MVGSPLSSHSWSHSTTRTVVRDRKDSKGIQNTTTYLYLHKFIPYTYDLIPISHCLHILVICLLILLAVRVLQDANQISWGTYCFKVRDKGQKLQNDNQHTMRSFLLQYGGYNALKIAFRNKV